MNLPDENCSTMRDTVARGPRLTLRAITGFVNKYFKGFNRGNYEKYYLLEYGSVQFGRNLQTLRSNLLFRRLRWSRGSVLAFGTQLRGFKPDWSRWIFQGEKILSTPTFGGEVKPSVPCRRFTACKRSQNVTWKSGIFRKNSSAISRPCSSTFGC